MKTAQAFFATVQETHGYNRKTFTLETGVDGKVSVTHFEGAFDLA